MGLIPDQEHLTVINPDLEGKRRSTYPGMAHWAGSGMEVGYYAKRGAHGGVLKPRPCEKYRDLMRGEVGPGVPHQISACKYFSENSKPPSII